MPKIDISGSAIIDNIRLEEQGSTPSTPASGFSAIYMKSDGLYVIDDAGNVTGPLVSTASGGVGALTDWTPSLTQSGAVTKTVTQAKYVRLGPSLYYVQCHLDVTGSGTAGNDIVIGNLPGTPIANGIYGSGWIYDASTNTFFAGAVISISAGLRIRAHLETDDVGSDPSFALASGDVIGLMAIYPT